MRKTIFFIVGIGIFHVYLKTCEDTWHRTTYYAIKNENYFNLIKQKKSKRKNEVRIFFQPLFNATSFHAKTHLSVDFTPADHQ